MEMKLTKQLKEYLKNRDFYNTFEIANTIADYKEGKHEDEREIGEEIWNLAIRYINEEELYLEDEERTRKRDETFNSDRYAFIHKGIGWYQILDKELKQLLNCCSIDDKNEEDAYLKNLGYDPNADLRFLENGKDYTRKDGPKYFRISDYKDLTDMETVSEFIYYLYND